MQDTNGTINVEVKSIKKHESGLFNIHEEIWRFGTGKPSPMTVIRSFQGNYICTEDELPRFGFVERGITPQPTNDEDVGTHAVCAIGFSRKHNKWFGWSHRAIYGFGVGDVIKEGDCAAGHGFTEEYIKEHPEEDKSLPVGFTAHTLDDAKTMAIAFAKSVN